MRKLILLLITCLTILLSVIYINSKQSVDNFQTDISDDYGQIYKGFNAEQIQPLPLETNFPEEKVILGKRLFHDSQLSRDNTISCSSCHNLNRSGTDEMPTSQGIDGKLGEVNAPTVFNSSFNFTQFWDGSASSLEEQAVGPIHNPVEMDSDWNQILPRLSADKQYRQAFQNLYPDGITADNIVDAIATFERTLVTPNSRFDQYLRGNKQALTKQELEGYQRFKDYGCISCHQGINIGGNMFQRIGILKEYFKQKQIKKVDLGRFNITGREEDKYVFKVPGLRNVAVTAPYLHDGSIVSLEGVVLIMGKYQLGRNLSEVDIHLITAFLNSLTGEWLGNPLQ